MKIEEKKVPIVEEGPRPVIEFVNSEEEEEPEKEIIDPAEEELTEAEMDALDGKLEEMSLAAVKPANGIDIFNEKMTSFFKPGTFTCAAFGVGCGVTLGVLCLTVGFWPTVLLGGAAGVGGFLGGASREKGKIMEKISKRFQ